MAGLLTCVVKRSRVPHEVDFDEMIERDASLRVVA